MNILFIAGNIPLPTRESNRIIIDIAERLISAGHHICLLYPKEKCPAIIKNLPKFRYLKDLPDKWKDGKITVNSLSYYRLPFSPIAFFLITLIRKKLIKAVAKIELPDIIHAHYVMPDGYFAYMLYKFYKIPYIISSRGSDIKNIRKSRGYIGQYNKVLKNAAAVVVHNLYQKEYFDKNFGTNSIIVSHGIDKNLLQEKSLPKEKHEITITTVASLIELKRISWVIRAVKNYTGDKEIKLKIIGSGPMKDELIHLAGNSSNIVFYGKLPHTEVCTHLHESDIFALPSRTETLGLVYLEAAGKMNAVIATKNTGVWGNFADRKEMLFACDFESFSSLLYEVINNDTLRNELAINAFNKVRENYTWDKVIENYDEIYHKALKHTYL